MSTSPNKSTSPVPVPILSLNSLTLESAPARAATERTPVIAKGKGQLSSVTSRHEQSPSKSPRAPLAPRSSRAISNKGRGAFHYTDFRSTGLEDLPQFEQLKTKGIESLKRSVQKSTKSVKTQNENGSHIGFSPTKAGTLDVSHRKLGDAYSYTVIKELQTWTMEGTKVHGVDSLEYDERLDGDYQEWKEKRDDFLDSLDNTHVKALDLRDNRISDMGLVKILQLMKDDHICKEVQKIDVSENQMRRRSAIELGQLIEKAPNLNNLLLEKMALNDNIMRILVPRLEAPSCVLAHLSLSSNKVNNEGCILLASALSKSATLEVLDLSWNEIQDKGAVALFAALEGNETLLQLDLSWNAIGTKTEKKRTVAVALSSMLCNNHTLVHLDLSQNQLSSVDCSIVGEGLAQNHSLLGLHMTGNGGEVDAYGHLAPEARSWPLEAGHGAMTRVLGKKVRGQEQWALRNNCWICGCFRETEFHYDLTLKDIKKVTHDESKGLEGAASAAPVEKEKKPEDRSVEEMLADLDKDPKVLEAEKAAALVKKLNPVKLLPHVPDGVQVSVKLCTSFDKWVPEEMMGNLRKKEKESKKENNNAEPQSPSKYKDEDKDKEEEEDNPKLGNNQVECSDELAKAAPLSGLCMVDNTQRLSAPKALAAEAKKIVTEGLVDYDYGTDEEDLNHVHAGSGRAGYELHRMVPPGVHFFAFSIDDGPITFDPFQPHVSTASLVAHGLKVPNNVILPAFVNTLGVGTNHKAEISRGMHNHSNLLPRTKNMDSVAQKKKWTFADSLFYHKTSKHEDAYCGRSAGKDWAYSRTARGKNKADVDGVEEIMRKYFPIIRGVFTHYSCLYSSEIFMMSMGAYNEITTKCAIIDGEASGQGRKGSTAAASEGGSVKMSATAGEGGSNKMNGTCTRTECELIFVSACIYGPRHEYNTKRALCRFQFLDSLAAIANVKYIKSGQCERLPQAVEKLLVECIGPLAERDDDRYGNDFRDKFLYHESCDTVLRNNYERLEKMYNKFTGAENTPLEDKTMSFKEWISLTDALKLADIGLQERSMKLAYVRSKLCYDDIFDESNSFKQLSFLEFLEAIVRCCHAMVESSWPMGMEITETGEYSEISPRYETVQKVSQFSHVISTIAMKKV